MSSPPLNPLLQEADKSPARFPGPESLAGKHVTLDRLQSKHAADLWDAVGRNQSLWAQVPSGPFATQADFTTYIASYTESTSHAFYAIISHSTGKAAGHVGLWDINLAHRVTEIGPVMYGPALQRSRAGTEVLYLLGKLVFEDLSFRRWEWRFNSTNTPSRNAAERYGFVDEGTLRKHMIVKGRSRDTCICSIVEEEWPRCKEVFEGWLDDENFDAEGRQRRSLGQVRESLMEDKTV